MAHVCPSPFPRSELALRLRCGGYVSFRVKFLLLCVRVFSALALGGCTTLSISEPEGGVAVHYIGYVKVAIPPHASRGSIYTSDISVLGLRIASGYQSAATIGFGVGVGYVRDRQVVVPLDCRIAVLVATQAQLDDAIERLLRQSSHAGICTAVSPSLETTRPGDKS